mmetsp:Transcript_119001/g.379512  ORF Transcript_119001/g.379512 Transcript_119001/m.379512 type:complete len:207 (+) Transcript_119001:198-818(+)
MDIAGAHKPNQRRTKTRSELHGIASKIATVVEALRLPRNPRRGNTSGVVVVNGGPSELLAALPQASPRLASCFRVEPTTVLLSPEPLPLVPPAIGPGVGSKATLKVLQVAPIVVPAVRPHENALAVHTVLSPLPSVAAAIHPIVGATPADGIVMEFALEVRTVGPIEAANAIFDAVHVLSSVLRPIWPRLATLAVLLVSNPLATVN